jgi:hypothetical protein
MVDDTPDGRAALLRDFAAHLEAVDGLSPKTARNYREAPRSATGCATTTPTSASLIFSCAI